MVLNAGWHCEGADIIVRLRIGWLEILRRILLTVKTLRDGTGYKALSIGSEAGDHWDSTVLGSGDNWRLASTILKGGLSLELFLGRVSRER